nr:MAG TPA: hypothetical protein [Caudoviricetes sp.]
MIDIFNIYREKKKVGFWPPPLLKLLPLVSLPHVANSAYNE